MSDDSFIREVNEELRQDQVKALWRRYGAVVIGVVVAVVVATAAYVGYDYWTQRRANQSGDAFSQALELAQQGENDEALSALEKLENDGYGSYPVLARMRAATVQATSGNPDAAIAGFDAVAADGSAPGVIRDIARLRAGLLLIDHGSYEDVARRVESLTADGNPLRFTAREVLGLSAWKQGNLKEAQALFEEILDDPQTPQGVRQRAELMSELIAGSGASS
jgi:hypothetical protein